MPEQRQHKREDVEFVLKYRIKNSGNAFKYAYYENISLGGVKIVELKNSLKRGTVIEVELSLPATPNSSLANSILLEGLSAHCEEVNKNTFNCGVQFKDLPPEKKEKLNIFLQYANGLEHLKED